MPRLRQTITNYQVNERVSAMNRIIVYCSPFLVVVLSEFWHDRLISFFLALNCYREDSCESVVRQEHIPKQL